MLLPQVTADVSDDIGKGGVAFGIPSGCARRQRLPRRQVVGKQHDQREQAQQRRGSACNRLGTPLPLRFDTQMRPRFLESDFDIPAQHIPSDDLFGADCQVGAAEGSRLEFLERIAHQDPADGQRVMYARRPPQRRARDILHPALLAAIPSHGLACPAGLRVGQARLQAGLTRPDWGGVFAVTGRRWVKQTDVVDASARPT